LEEVEGLVKSKSKAKAKAKAKATAGSKALSVLSGLEVA